MSVANVAGGVFGTLDAHLPFGDLLESFDTLDACGAVVWRGAAALAPFAGTSGNTCSAIVALHPGTAGGPRRARFIARGTENSRRAIALCLLRRRVENAASSSGADGSFGPTNRTRIEASGSGKVAVTLTCGICGP